MKVLLFLCIIFYKVFSDETFSDCGTLCRCNFESRDTVVSCKGELIQEVPKKLPWNTTELYFSGTAIKEIPENAFTHMPQLTQIFFKDHDKNACLLETLKPQCFDNMKHLRVIGIVRCHQLRTIGPGVFGKFRNLNRILIHHSGLTSIPSLDVFGTENDNYNTFMLEIDFSNNQIDEIKELSFLSVKTHTLKLDNNKLKRIHNAAFYGSQIVSLQLQENPMLDQLDEGAFDEIEKLEKIDLSYTSITKLPKKGLANIRELRLKGTKTLKQFPSILHFNKITLAEVYYPHHCCLFKNPEKQDPNEWKAYLEFQRRVQLECAASTFGSTVSTTKSGFSQDEVSTASSLYNFGKRVKRHDFIYNDTNENLGFGPAIDPHLFNEHGNFHRSPDNKSDDSNGMFNDKVSIPPNSTNTLTAYCGQVVKDYRQVICTPEPDAFNPCEDLMGYEWLRIFVWIILLAALFGNSVVLIVLIKSRKKMNVTKFLMCNLAFADLMMGVYLLLLASIDAHTLGEYFNYAVIWQNDGGCQAAGFLTVFSCELSIFTLTIITIERWYAISHAIQLTKRLRIRQAMLFMAFGWLYALFMAHLPLVGISSYGHVSICLPMTVNNSGDAAYVVSLLVINGVAFLCICACYINMYCKVRGSHAIVRNNDAKIAKRMAMLVFTNFACWAPIAFFGLTASAGIPLIDITNSKILLVFFYPLNSFANPYLYVIITKQFRKDLYILLGRYGLCTERANRYRVTFTSSHSRNSLALHNAIHTRNGICKSTSSLRPPAYARISSNSESNCSTTTFLNTNSKQPSVRIRLPENKKIVDTGLNESPENSSSTERRLRSPPPFKRNHDEYGDFNTSDKDDFQKETHGSSVESGDSNLAENSLFGENPWTEKQDDESESCEKQINSINSDTLEDFAGLNLSDVKTLNNLPFNGSIQYSISNFGLNSTDDENEDDSVQQTLLKHCTLRESPVATIDKKFSSDSLLSENNRNYGTKIYPSKSSPNMEDFNKHPALFQR